jgi:hypothetical protein
MTEETKSFDVENALASAIDAFDASQVPYALCGGLALAVHGHPRATDVIDFLVPAESIQLALKALRQAGFPLTAGPIPLGTSTEFPQRLFHATKVSLNQHLTVDLLEVSASYLGAWDSRQSVPWKKRNLAAVSKGGLIAMKKLSQRKKDQVDLETLDRFRVWMSLNSRRNFWSGQGAKTKACL